MSNSTGMEVDETQPEKSQEQDNRPVEEKIIESTDDINKSSTSTLNEPSSSFGFRLPTLLEVAPVPKILEPGLAPENFSEPGIPAEKQSKNKDDLSSGTSVMAPVGTVGSVSISLHPLVILNISEHWTRQNAGEAVKNIQVLGALIGKQNGRHIEIMNSFELAFDKVCDDIIINREYYSLKDEQYKQVFSEMDLLGWYTTGDAPNLLDLNIHKQMSELLDSPIFLKLNPLMRHTDLPVAVYESIVDVVEGEATLLLVELTYTLATEEAERIGIDHVARIHDTPECSLVSENLQAQYNAIKMLASRVHLIAEFVVATQKGEVPFNHEILRQINSLTHRLPVLSSSKFKEEFYNQTNDVALMAYLGSITKCCNTMNKFINRFNQLHERYAMGRRMRGLFF